MNSNRNIIIVANSDDRKAAELVQAELKNTYNIQSNILYPIELKINDVTSDKVYILLGGPKINLITEAYWKTTDLIYKDRLIFIAVKDYIAIVFGRWNRKSTEEATLYFINNNLKDFIEYNSPISDLTNQKPEPKIEADPTTTQPDQSADTSKQPDSKSEVKLSQKVAEAPIKYENNSKNPLQFYKRTDGKWFIKYYNEETTVSETKGVLYIHFLLKNHLQLYLISELWCKINGGDSEALARNCGEFFKKVSKDDIIDGDEKNENNNQLNYKDANKKRNMSGVSKRRKEDLIAKINSATSERDRYRNIHTSILVDENYDSKLHGGKSQKFLLFEYEKFINLHEKERKKQQAILDAEFPSKNKLRDKYRQRILKAREAFYKKLKSDDMPNLVKYFKLTINSTRGYKYTPKDPNESWILNI